MINIFPLTKIACLRYNINIGVFAPILYYKENVLMQPQDQQAQTAPDHEPYVLDYFRVSDDVRKKYQDQIKATARSREDFGALIAIISEKNSMKYNLMDDFPDSAADRDLFKERVQSLSIVGGEFLRQIDKMG